MIICVTALQPLTSFHPQTSYTVWLNRISPLLDNHVNFDDVGLSLPLRSATGTDNTGKQGTNC